LIGQHLDGGKCEFFTANMRVLVEASGLYTYPDLSVVCGEPRFADPYVDSLTNPTLLIEVLSPSTEDYDRGRKAAMYRKIPSLQELLLIAQDSHELELSRRMPDGNWSLMAASGLEASIDLQSIGYTLRLRDLYKRVAVRYLQAGRPVSTQPKTFVTPEEYLELERKAEFKSEYHDGKIIPMPPN
jgi:Uma2 family endonuclease